VNEAEVAECYRKHNDALTHFAASQVGPSHADDVLSSALLSVLQRCRQDTTNEGSESVKDTLAYLYRSVANASAKHWRTLDRRQIRNQAFYLASRQAVPATSGGAGPTDQPTAVGQIIEAMAELTVQQRAVVHLTYWEDLTPAMVAERLGISEGTVRSHLARARSKLRKAIK